MFGLSSSKKQVIIAKFFRSKCYSMITRNEQKRAAAGVKRSVAKCLTHVEYVDILANACMKSVVQRTLISKNHNIFMQEMQRVALSYFEIKRYVLDGGINTVPYGYRGLEFS